MVIYLENGKLILDSRKTLSITGVNKITRFDSEEFLIDTTLGYLKVKGKKLTLGKLDNNSKETVINGMIDSIAYQGHKKGNDESLIKKIFKLTIGR